MTEREIAEAIVDVLGPCRWVGVSLARAYLDAASGSSDTTVARRLYDSGAFTLAKAKELLPALKTSGFLAMLPRRQKLGSAENPITKLFPAAITEQRFMAALDSLHDARPTAAYEDARGTGHTLVDFTLVERDAKVPINVKNAGTRFENARQLVGLSPDDCIPVPVYKAYDAIEKEPNLLYAIAVDYSLIQTIRDNLVPLFSTPENLVWELLNAHAGFKIREAEDHFVYELTRKHWDRFGQLVKDSVFRVISARKAIRILQKMPRRTPGIGLRAWGTGASAEVNVHVSVAEDTKSWDEVFSRIREEGLGSVVGAINRRTTEVVYDPEI